MQAQTVKPKAAVSSEEKLPTARQGAYAGFVKAPEQKTVHVDRQSKASTTASGDSASSRGTAPTAAPADNIAPNPFRSASRAPASARAPVVDDDDGCVSRFHFLGGKFNGWLTRASACCHAVRCPLVKCLTRTKCPPRSGGWNHPPHRALLEALPCWWIAPLTPPK